MTEAMTKPRFSLATLLDAVVLLGIGLSFLPLLLRMLVNSSTLTYVNVGLFALGIIIYGGTCRLIMNPNDDQSRKFVSEWHDLNTVLQNVCRFFASTGILVTAFSGLVFVGCGNSTENLHSYQAILVDSKGGLVSEWSLINPLTRGVPIHTHYDFSMEVSGRSKDGQTVSATIYVKTEIKAKDRDAALKMLAKNADPNVSAGKQLEESIKKAFSEAVNSLNIADLSGKKLVLQTKVGQILSYLFPSGFGWSDHTKLEIENINPTFSNG